MAETRNPEELDRPPTGLEVESDSRMELLLDELVASRARGPELPSDFTERCLTARPFAPWEVRRASSWKAALAVGGGLFAASAALFLTPLLRLSPETALATWGRLLWAAFAKPVGAAVSAFPLVADAAARLAPSSAPALVGLSALCVVAVTGLVVALRAGRPAKDAAARRA